MPGAKFFSQLGLFVIPEFLSESACQELIKIIAAAPTRRGLTVGEGFTDRLDEQRRSVGDAKVPEASTVALKRSLVDLKPDIERHFGMPLEWGGEGPDYLVYRTGDFFKPHRDNAAYPNASKDPNDSDSRVLRRRVAVVLFLNRHSREHRGNCFGGGLLNFYGLLDGPQWKDCALGLEPEPGLLVGFPASMVHEVTPITFGERYTVLTAFHAPVAVPQLSPQ